MNSRETERGSKMTRREFLRLAGLGTVVMALSRCRQLVPEVVTPVTSVPTREIPTPEPTLLPEKTETPIPTPTSTSEPSPSPTPLAEKLFAGGSVELSEEQLMSVEEDMFLLVPKLSRFASEGLIGGKPIGENASSEETRLSYKGVLVNLYPAEPTGVELVLQVDPELGEVAILPTVRDPESPNNGAVVVSSSTDPEVWNHQGTEAVFMKAQTENGADSGRRWEWKAKKLMKKIAI